MPLRTTLDLAAAEHFVPFGAAGSTRTGINGSRRHVQAIHLVGHAVRAAEMVSLPVRPVAGSDIHVVHRIPNVEATVRAMRQGSDQVAILRPVGEVAGPWEGLLTRPNSGDDGDDCHDGDQSMIACWRKKSVNPATMPGSWSS